MSFSKILNSKITFTFAIILIGYLSFSLNAKIALKKESAERIDNIKAEIKELSDKEAKLLKLQAYYNSKDFLYKEARRILGYQKPGEEVYILIPQKSKIEQEKKKEQFKIIKKKKAVDLKNCSNPKKWWYYLFGNINYMRQ